MASASAARSCCFNSAIFSSHFCGGNFSKPCQPGNLSLPGEPLSWPEPLPCRAPVRWEHHHPPAALGSGVPNRESRGGGLRPAAARRSAAGASREGLRLRSGRAVRGACRSAPLPGINRTGSLAALSAALPKATARRCASCRCAGRLVAGRRPARVPVPFGQYRAVRAGCATFSHRRLGVGMHIVSPCLR